MDKLKYGIMGTLAKTDAANTFGVFNQTFDTSTLFIDSVSHRVGIGTTTPQNILNVIGQVNATQFIVNASVGLTGNYSVNGCWLAYKGGIMYGTNCTAF